MTTLHWRVLMLLGWLTFLFNIERLGVLVDALTPLGIGFYLLGAAAALLPLLPISQRLPLVLQGSFIVLLQIMALVVAQIPLFDDVALYRNVSGMLLLLLTLFLSYRVAEAVAEFRKVIETVTLADEGSRLRHLNEVRSLVDTEIVRSRRFERPLSLVVVQADASSINTEMHRLVKEMQRSMMQRYVLATMSRILSRSLRRTDLMLEEGKPGRLLLVAPETNDEEARQMGRRITRVIEERLGITAAFGTASFPQQALTFEDLRDVAEQGLQSRASDQPAADGDELLELGVKAAQDTEVARV